MVVLKKYRYLSHRFRQLFGITVHKADENCGKVIYLLLLTLPQFSSAFCSKAPLEIENADENCGKVIYLLLLTIPQFSSAFYSRAPLETKKADENCGKVI